jgi:hypothetical protein
MSSIFPEFGVGRPMHLDAYDSLSSESVPLWVTLPLTSPKIAVKDSESNLSFSRVRPKLRSLSLASSSALASGPGRMDTFIEASSAGARRSTI